MAPALTSIATCLQRLGIRNYFIRYLKIYLSYSSTCTKTAKSARTDSEPNVFSDINHKAGPVDDKFEKQIKEGYIINILL